MSRLFSSSRNSGYHRRNEGRNRFSNFSGGYQSVVLPGYVRGSRRRDRSTFAYNSGRGSMTFQVVGIGIITLAMVLMFQSLQSLSSISTSAQAKSDKEVQILVNFNQSVGVGQVSKSQLAEISFVDPAELEKQKVEEEAKKQPKYYVVSQGDSLYSISQKYKVDLTQLAESNNIEKPYNLVVGQKIIIPAQT